MEIVVDTSEDITQLFKLISADIKKSGFMAECILDNFILISFSDSKIKNIVATTITKYIIERFEYKIAKNLLKDFEILKEDYQDVLDCLKKDNELRKKRFNILKKEVRQYINSGRINVSGIVSFRLNLYKEELLFTLEVLTEEVTAKKSYDEFISLMRYFTEIQSPVTDVVVLSENSGKYLLTDINGNPINMSFDEEFADEISPIGLSGEDLLISNLMAAMPKKIIFNDVNRDKPIISTISRIFEGRISY